MSEPTDWRRSPAKRFQARAIAGLGYPLIAALGRTFRWEVAGREHLEAVERSGRPPIMAFFHGRIIHATIFFKRRGIVVMISENFDGEWIARIIERFGYGTARGSSSRGAVKALAQLRRDMAAGRSTGFAVDGPRGPALVAQAGAIWLAKATGNPIVPFHAEAQRFWTASSWDRTQVPKPWSKVAMVIGEPMFVPPDVDDASLERHRVALEQTLRSLMTRATSLARR